MEIGMQSGLITDDQKRHFVTICFLCAVHHQHLVISLQNTLRTAFDKEQMSDLIEIIFLHLVYTIPFFQLLDQGLHERQWAKGFSTKLRLDVVDVSRFE